jgi:predicted nucleic acid-binding protein
MFVLDTNVISEPLRPQPDPSVVRWLDAQPRESLFLTTINLAELMAGVEQLPTGKRRHDLELAFSRQILPLFAGRVLAFDERAAHAFAQVHARARSSGRPIAFADGAIAAIALVHRLSLATRNVDDFSGTGVQLINPWQAQA